MNATFNDPEDVNGEEYKCNLTERPIIGRSDFDFCAYDRFIEDEDYKDPDADDDCYHRQFILKHKTDATKDVVAKMEIVNEEPKEVKWHNLIDRATEIAMAQYETTWQIDQPLICLNNMLGAKKQDIEGLRPFDEI